MLSMINPDQLMRFDGAGSYTLAESITQQRAFPDQEHSIPTTAAAVKPRRARPMSAAQLKYNNS